MDFNFTEEQEMIRELAREIFEGEVELARIKQLESEGEAFDEALWNRLAESNLLGLLSPESQGGMGFGITEACVLLQEVGRTVAPAPILPSLVLGALPIIRLGSRSQQERWLGPLARGEIVLSGAWVDRDAVDPLAPGMVARRDGENWRLDGGKRFVPIADRARAIVIPASTEEGVQFFVVDPGSDGSSLDRHVLTHKQAGFDLTLDGVRVDESDRLAGQDGADAQQELSWLYDAALVAHCALQLGVSERSIEMTADYARERCQFGVPIGSFQAVQHRLADAYIDLEAIRWTLWRAVGRLEAGLSAGREAMVAKFWAAEAGSRIASSAQHLHGGHGVDMDYGIHRYFLWTKAIELELGSANPQLDRLGLDLARTGPEEAR